MARRIAVTLLLSLAALSFPRPAAAECPDTMPVRNALDTFWSGLPEDHLMGFAYLLSDPKVQTGQSGLFCRSAAEETSGGQCQPQAGSSADGVITVNGNWSWQLAAGCPDPGGVWGHPIVVAAISSQEEGSPTHRGRAVVVSVGYDQNYAGYNVDWAHAIDSEGMSVGSLAASDLPVPLASGLRSTDDGAALVDLAWKPFPTYDDCGQVVVSTCVDSPGRKREVLAGYVIYMNQSSCGSPPLSGLLSSGLWTPILTVPGTTSAATRVPDPGGDCLYFAIGLLLREGISRRSCRATRRGCR